MEDISFLYSRLEEPECLKNYGWRVVTLYRRQVFKTIPKKKK